MLIDILEKPFGQLYRKGKPYRLLVILAVLVISPLDVLLYHVGEYITDMQTIYGEIPDELRKLARMDEESEKNVN